MNMRAYNWIVQIGILACSSRIQIIEGFDRETLKLGLGKTIINANHNSIEPGEASDRVANLVGKIDISRITPDSPEKQCGERRKCNEIAHIGLDLSLAVSPQTAESGSGNLRNKKPKLDFRAPKRVLVLSSQTLAAISLWKRDLVDLTLDKQQKFRLQAHVEVVLRSVENLFQRGIVDRNDYHGVSEDEGRYKSTSGHLSRNELGDSEKGWLTAIAEVEGIWDVMESPNVLQAMSILNRWFDLTMGVFLNLQEHEIIQSCCLSHFLNKENQGQFILSYVKTRFYPFDISAVYVNFNQKLSLLEDDSMKNMRPVFQLLSQDTWKKIELQYVHFELERYHLETIESPNKSPTTEFMKIRKAFLDLDLTIGSRSTLMYKMKDFFENLVQYISSQIMSQEVRVTDEKLLEFKILYDMLSFFLRHYEHHLPVGFMDEFKKKVEYYQTRIFEETIGVIASLLHSLYMKSKQVINHINGEDGFQKNIPHRILELCKNSKYISDSNENRQISNFEKTEKENDVTGRTPRSQLREHWRPEVDSSISMYPHIRSERVEFSVKRSRLQFENYVLQVTTLAFYNSQKNPNQFRESIPFLSKNLYGMVFEKVKNLDREINQELLKYTPSTIPHHSK
ncbi:hypothetical protein PGT21_022741 [Puccinia graminis f. sp. tritici]|uniref:Uncharacterized protein n=1 Tax=Puccinia graminis f. sp. tritici TaxID=56615 RepID=A0A5B0N2E9_PUCGR|nr:hypothetical protein PGT21_022741 [Puccinia graminis f. sp. tritici]